MILRDYQSDVADRVRWALAKHDRIVIACPTGSGKTAIAISGLILALPPMFEPPVLWITHRHELLEQVEKELSHAAGFWVRVQMIQSYKPESMQPHPTVFIDEGHHVCADQYESVFRANPRAKVIALTATPYRMDGQGLGRCGFTSIIKGPDILELTQSGVLCPAVVFAPVHGGNNNSWTPEALVSEIQKHEFKLGITYCRTVADCVAVTSGLNAAGVPSVTISSQVPSKERSLAMARIRSGEIKMVVNHTILTEGVDLPMVDLIVLNRHTESRCLWRQMIGRGLRSHKLKDGCVILDPCGNSFTHGSIYDKEVLSLDGSVERTEAREINSHGWIQAAYKYSAGGELKPWKHHSAPSELLANLVRQRSKSPLQRLLIA